MPVPGCSDVGSDFTIQIHDTLPCLNSDGISDAEVFPATDLHVPEHVPVFKLMAVKFVFTFEPMQDRPLPVLRRQVNANVDIPFERICESDEDPFEDIMDLDATDFPIHRHNAYIESSTDNGVDVHDDMLFCQIDHGSTPLPTPEASNCPGSEQETTVLDSAELYTSNIAETEPSLNLGTAKILTDFAIRTILGGRQTKSTRGIKIRKPHPTRPLSTIMPILWSPSFKNVCLPASIVYTYRGH